MDAVPPLPPPPAPATPPPPAWAPGAVCAFHPEVADGLQRCGRCGRWLCADCHVVLEERVLCGDCKEERVREVVCGVAAEDELVLASVLQRFAAVFLDSLIFVVPYVAWVVWLTVIEGQGRTPGVVSMIVLFLALAYMTLGRVVYEGVLLARDGQTLGKKAMRIRVVTPQGAAIRPGQAWGRSFARFLLDACLSVVNYLPALFGRERACIHDHLASTRVVRIDT